MYKILIVDEEEHLLWALEKNLFPDRDDIQVVTANSGERGLELLQNGGIHLLVSDIKMPGRVDGFQLILRAKEIAPESKVIIMTAFGTNRIQNFADRIGITHYIEKPFNVSELRDAVLELLDEKQGFQGVLSDLELTDIIQMLCLAKRTALLHLKYRDHRGKIAFDKGDILHSEFDDVVGNEAVFRMLALKQGDIFMQSDFHIEKPTVTMSWQDLLFEGVKQADEVGLGPDDEDDDDFTDIGMGVATAAVERIVAQSAPEMGHEASFPFFSEEELAEIEDASGKRNGHVPDVDESHDLPVSEELLGSSNIASISRFSSPAHPKPTVFAETDDHDIEFRSPFRAHTAVGVRQLAPVEPLSPRDTPMSPVPSVTQMAPPQVPSAAPAPAPQVAHEMPPDAFQFSLEGFARECPGLVVTGIISTGEGIALNACANRPSEWDPEAIAVFFADVVAAAERSVRVMSVTDQFNELQIALEDQFVLFRRLEMTNYMHVAVVEKATSLGVAVVLMRRFQKTLRRSLEAR